MNAALIIRLLIGGIGAALAYVSARANYDFWAVTFAANAAFQSLYCSLSLAAGALKYGLIIYAEVFRIHLRREKMLAALLCVAFAFDLLSGLGYARMTRDDISADQTSVNASRILLEQDVLAASERVARFTTSRTVGSISAEMAPLRPETCQPESRFDRCVRARALQAELDDAARRDEAESQLAELRQRLASMPAEKESDPQAGLLADALNAGLQFVGVTASPAQAKVVLALLVVLLLELGPPVAVRAAFQARQVQPEPKAAPEPPKPAAPPPSQAAPVSNPAPRPRSRPRGPDALLDVFERAALDKSAAPSWIRVAPDGWQYFGQHDAATAAGCSKPTVGRRLARFAAEGILEVRASNHGTAIKLLYPQRSPVLRVVP